MKELTIVIPVYNTEKYIRRCLDSVLIDEIKDKLEIIAVNDGGKDNSINILREYEKANPNTVIVVDKENGGHGSTINKGLELATGKYFKVIDSDDWVNSIDFIKLVNILEKEETDLVVTNYTKEYVYNGKSETITFNKLKSGKVVDFKCIKVDDLDNNYFAMANSTFKTEVLKRANLKLFEKTFYVDMQYNVFPIIETNNYVYYDLDIYRYYSGRPEQSMNLENFVKNKSNHEKVIKSLITFYAEKCENMNENKKNYISFILYNMLITHYYIYCVYLTKGSKETMNKIKDFDNFLHKKDVDLYNKLNVISQIKYSRKTGFYFVKSNPNRFSKFITRVGIISKGLRR